MSVGGRSTSSSTNFSVADDETKDEPEGLAELIAMSGEALDTDDNEFDPSFDLD